MQLSFINIFVKQLFSWNYDKKQSKNPFFDPVFRKNESKTDTFPPLGILSIAF